MEAIMNSLWAQRELFARLLFACFCGGIIGFERSISSLRLGYYSQRGNTLFPTWECFVPNVGTLRSQHGNITLSYSYYRLSVDPR